MALGRIRSGVLALIALSLCSCAAPAGSRRADAEAYLEHMKVWAPIQSQTGAALDRILATHFVDEAAVLREIADLRPRIESHVAQLRSYTPRTDSVDAIHSRYRDGWNELLAGLAAIETGFAAADYSKVADGRQAIAQWQATLLETARRLGEVLGADST